MPFFVVPLALRAARLCAGRQFWSRAAGSGAARLWRFRRLPPRLPYHFAITLLRRRDPGGGWDAAWRQSCSGWLNCATVTLMPSLR